MAHRRTGRSAGRPFGSLTTARTDLELFGQLHRGQARIWRKRQLVLQRRVDALAEGEAMPDSLTAELQRIDTFLARSTAAMVNVQEAQEEALAALPTELLEAQLAAEIVAAAKTWTPQQWDLVLGVRDEQIRKQYPGLRRPS